MRAIARYVLATIGLGALAYGILIIGRDGLSNLRVEQSIENGLPAAADDAIRLNRLNPDAYHARALLYQNAGQPTETTMDLERAIDLRPRDHFLWLELGYCRYQARDMEGAIADFAESARLAPFYAQPHWYLGNVLLETGKHAEGFAEIRRAVTSDPGYLTEAIQLADQAYSGDDHAVVQAILPQTSTARLALAQFFIKQNRVPTAMELFRTAREPMSETDQRTLLGDLLAAKKFPEAYDVWLANHPQANLQKVIPLINDGSFESEIDGEGLGFNWQVDRNLKKVVVVRDEHQPQSGAFCLRVDFGGNSIAEILSQIMLTEASTRYELSFASRTERLVTGGPPVVAVVDAGNGEVLAQSKPLTESQIEWENQSVEFLTGSDTHAVTIIIKRKPCTSSPCPAFGHAWFDNFTCKKL